MRRDPLPCRNLAASKLLGFPIAREKSHENYACARIINLSGASAHRFARKPEEEGGLPTGLGAFLWEYLGLYEASRREPG